MGQWLRVGAASLGLGVALTFGSGVALAVPDGTSDPDSTSSGSDAAGLEKPATASSDTPTGSASGRSADSVSATSAATASDAPTADPRSGTGTVSTSSDGPVSKVSAQQYSSTDKLPVLSVDSVDEELPGEDLDERDPLPDSADELVTDTDTTADADAAGSDGIELDGEGVSEPEESTEVVRRDSSQPPAAQPTSHSVAAVTTSGDQADDDLTVLEAPANTESNSESNAESDTVSNAVSTAEPEPVTLILDVITEREVVANPVRSVVLGLFGLLGFDPNATGSSPNPLVPALDAIWGLYRRMEMAVADVLELVGIPATTTTTTYVTTLVVPMSYTAADLFGPGREFDGAYSAELEQHFLADTVRGITTYTAVTYQQGGLHYPVDPPGDIVVLTSGWDPSAVSAHANMAVVYDFYVVTLTHESFDNAGAAVAATVVSDILDNAYWYRTHQVFVFGHDFERALDIVGHEYTHAVIDSVVAGQHGQLLGQNAQSLALEEAYSDILGALIEGKQGPERWLIGEDYGCSAPSETTRCAIRDLADPAALDTAAHVNQFSASASAHRNSTIFSHAAYRMMTDDDTANVSADTWAQVIYGSLHRLTPGASFADAAEAVIAEADDIFDDVEMAAVRQAFIDVGIPVPDNATAIAA